mmetsp:Transcript_14070/g.20795  ORF Transcript_14070/g.20795 Transcript_14070/m.20795 type:complete len:91 (-) Transcript_14070:697-969(-)
MFNQNDNINIQEWNKARNAAKLQTLTANKPLTLLLFAVFEKAAASSAGIISGDIVLSIVGCIVAVKVGDIVMRGSAAGTSVASSTNSRDT